jgi:predicted RNA-binding Zn-ribbon protein involved in translation (DUF1610 family)
MSKYVTVKCPRCMSTSQLQATSITGNAFLCPVCSEGEIKSQDEPRRIYAGDRRIAFVWKDLIIIYSTSR